MELLLAIALILQAINTILWTGLAMTGALRMGEHIGEVSNRYL